VNPLGGHIGSDNDELGPPPELFDIHVMIFAGDPQSTIEGLERFFAIDREAAERLVEDVPVIVKRAAEPDVAAEMVDVLGNLGAQVVLLPAASLAPSETDLLELKEPSIPPPPSTAPPAQPAATWGALESADPPPSRAAAAPRRADTVDLIAAGPMAELELEARAPARSAPPTRRGVIDDELVIAPLYEPGEVEARTRGHAVSLPPADTGRKPDSMPPALGAPMSSAPPGPVVQTLPPTRSPSLPDLGLGSVPPLPTLGGGPPPVPGAAMKGSAGRAPPPPAARPQPPPPPGVVPGAAQQRALYERSIDVDLPLKLPSLGVTPTSGPHAAAKPAGSDNYWSGRRAAATAGPELGEVDAATAPGQALEVVAPGSAPGEALRALPARPPIASRMGVSSDAEAEPTRSVARAAVQIGLGLLVFAYFMHSGNSILLGNADVLSIVMHGFAIFGIGAGVLELKG